MNKTLRQPFDVMPPQRGSDILNVFSETSDVDLVALLHQRALIIPDACAYVFLVDGESSEQSISYGQLDAQVQVVAAQLQKLSKAGERALLLYPAGLEYIVAFLGCLYSGVIAVPAYPPSRHHMYRLKTIIQDATPSIILTTKDLCERFQRSQEETWDCHELMWLATDMLEKSNVDSWVPPVLRGDSLAFLQYTSGSTGDPKGVMISHGNLMANQRIIQKAFNHTQETVVVGWLPLYHDMGLIGNVLQPLYLGATAVLMSPLAFLEQPARWLKAISKFRATTSGGPNFAYELCIRKITSEQKRELDLSCWTVAFNGSEPVRAATFSQFSDAFAECGFRQQAFFPCYGLAESTLFVTGHSSTGSAQLKCSDGDQSTKQEYLQKQVSCGHAWDDHAICVVNPETRILCAGGEEGEIWVTGPSVAQGYWNRPEDSDDIFRASLSGFVPSVLAGDGGERTVNPQYIDYLKRRFLRTGDLGIIENDHLFVTGRIKDLIILRGRNYYPQDLEQAVNDGVAGIRPHCCAAFSVERAGEEILVIAVEVKRKTIAQDKAQQILGEMRRILVEASDAPIGVLLLVAPGAVLKTSSGKVQRQAIKQAYLTQQLNVLASAGASQTSLPSRMDWAGENGIDGFLAEALHELSDDQRVQCISHFLRMKLAQLLGISEAHIAPTSSMRFLGLDSLRVMEFKHVTDAWLGTEIPLSLFLSDQSIHEFARTVATEIIPLSSAAAEFPCKETMDLSCSQQAIWTVHQLAPRSITYNLHISLRFQGTLSEEILRRALSVLLQRHPQLRTRYWINGESMQQSAIPSGDLPAYLTIVDAANWTQSNLQEDMGRRVREPFNLSGGPLLRVTSYRQNQQGHVLLFCIHHAAVDFSTGLILLSELQVLLKGMTDLQYPDLPDLPERTVQYEHFVVWQQAYSASGTFQNDREYWHRKLTGALPILALPTDCPRPLASTHRGASHALRLNADLTHEIKQLGRQYGATLFMTLLAAYKVLLHRYTHQNDIIVGTASNGRPQARFKHVAGNFVNPIALRSHPDPLLSFGKYLTQVRDTVIDALSHADYPFSVLVEHLQPERSADHWPVYQTWLMLQQGRSGLDDELVLLALGEKGEGVSWGDWIVSSEGIEEQVENFDLRVIAAEDQNTLLLSFKYRSDLFEAETIARMAGHFQVLLQGIVVRSESLLGELPLLTQSERMQQLFAWNPAAAAPAGSESLHALFEAQVLRTPAQMAIACNGVQLTYAQLNKSANQLAYYLREQGVGPEKVVGLCVRRSVDMMVGILAILKAGGAYVPIDPDFPAARIESLLHDSRAMYLVTQQALVNKMPVHELPIFCLDSDRDILVKQSKDNPQNLSHPDHLAYVIYTSGSAGKPKGVGISHANAVHSTTARFDTYQDSVAGFLLLSSYTFDSSVAGIFWTLCQGGCIHIPAEGEEKDPRLLSRILADGGVTHLLSLPSLYGLLLDNISQTVLEKLKVIVVAGEACPADLVMRHHQKLRQVSFFNEYGPTEGTVWSSVYQIRAVDTAHLLPIGKPIRNVQLYLLDRHLNPVPIGVSGELYIGGSGLARGYQHSPDLTAERFIPNPFVTDENSGDDDSLRLGSRLYRTGDLARYRADGNIEFLGRIDHQVKIRGFRIELEEIEAKLRQHPGVMEAVVLAREDRAGDRRLVAYLMADSMQFLAHSRCNSEGFDAVLLTDDLAAFLAASRPVSTAFGKSPSNQYLQKFLKNSLPDFMVPLIFMFMTALPQLPNGKLDREALPAPEIASPILDQEWLEPSNSVERSLLTIWKEVLEVDRPFGIYDNFFDLGGHSLLAIQVMGRIQHDFNVELPVTNIFEAPTIAQLAVLVAQQQIDGQDLGVLESLLDEFEQLSDETGVISDMEMASMREDS